MITVGFLMDFGRVDWVFVFYFYFYFITMQRIEKLDNGLRIVTKNLLNTNSVTVLILVGAGSRYETKEINGISHFLEHMFFKGLDREVISEAEVKKARDYIKGKMVLKLEDSEEYAQMIGKYQLLFGVSKDLEEIYAALDLVTVEQVMDAARELFKPEELRLAVIGPYSEVSRFEKLIGL